MKMVKVKKRVLMKRNKVFLTYWVLLKLSSKKCWELMMMFKQHAWIVHPITSTKLSVQRKKSTLALFFW